MRTYAMIILVLIFLVPASVLAAGPMINYGDTSGDTIVSMPPVWDNSAPIEYTIESGTCGPFSNDEMVEKYEDILAVWSDIEGVDISFSAVTGEIGSIDDSNYADYFYYGLEGEDVTVATDGINPVMFDDDGALTDALFGTGGSSSVLGFASVTGLDDDALYDGEVVINCKCMEDHPTENCDEVVFSEEDLSFTITHEMGHFLNMGHSQANYNLMIDWAADDFDEATKPFGDGDLPIMFPTSSDMTEVIPQADDVLTLKQLYPSGSLSDDYCKVEGYIVDSEGEYVPCLDVWAVTEDEDPAETLTVTTGSSNTYGTGTGDDFDPDATCDENCGYFLLYIKPATAYSIQLYDVYSAFTGGSSVGPCTVTQPEYGMYGDELYTITAEDCPTATDEVIDIGTIDTDGTVVEAGDGDGGGGDGGGGDGGGGGSGGGGSEMSEDDKFNPIDYWSCSLRHHKGRSEGTKPLSLTCLFVVSILFLCLLRIFSKSTVLPHLSHTTYTSEKR